MAKEENNNGWTHINSVDDLPSGLGVYFTANRAGVRSNPVNSEEVKILFLNGFATHYQPIKKPQPPIY